MKKDLDRQMFAAAAHRSSHILIHVSRQRTWRAPYMNVYSGDFPVVTNSRAKLGGKLLYALGQSELCRLVFTCHESRRVHFYNFRVCKFCTQQECLARSSEAKESALSPCPPALHRCAAPLQV